MPAMTNEQLEHFEYFGFVTAEGVIDPEKVINPVIEEYAGVLDSLADELYEEGRISSRYEDLEFGERMVQVYEESDEIHQGYFDFSLPQRGVTEDTPFWAGPAVFNAMTSPDLLDAVESFVGPEIYSNPVQHIRIKVPESRSPRDELGRVKFGVTPWHQDCGVITPDADDSLILTVWYPLMDANEENGCLQVIPGSHRGDELLTHCPGGKKVLGSLHIPESEFEAGKAVPVPLKKGDALFMTKYTIHSSLPNNSDRVRFSMDLRYNPVGQSTGRTSFPGFVARSHSNPDTELHDPARWNEMWLEARSALAKGEEAPFNRWNSDHPLCA